MRYLSHAALLAVLLAMLVAVVWPLLSHRPNVVLVVVDALRKDHLSCYGYGRNTTPVIDGLARDGLLFENDVSQAPWTAASMSSVMTSMYPSQAGVHAIEGPAGMRRALRYYVTKLDEGAMTLADIFKQNGYRTGCVTTNRFSSTEFGTLQGFDHVYELYGYINARDVMDAAEDIVEMHQSAPWYDRPGQFFIYLHLMDVHAPTEPPPPYDGLYPTLDSTAHEERHRNWDYVDAGPELDTEAFRVYRSHKVSLYDGALNFADAQLGRFIDLLKEEGLYDNTIIVIAADHGEELWDHARFEKERYIEDIDETELQYGVNHGHTMFCELLDVPLIFHGPGVPEAVVDTQVRNLDIAPTLLGLTDITLDDSRMQGVDLIARLGSGTLEDMPAFSEDICDGYEKKAYQDGRYKYVRYFKGADIEFLFDKQADQAETKDISKERPEVARLMREKLDAVVNGYDKPAGRPVVMDQRTKDELRAVGYLQ